mgnify:CR=1 FL=1
MINPHETEAFDFLYNFVHKHAEGVYYLTFQDGVQISAEYDTDYETDNGIDTVSYTHLTLPTNSRV